MRFLGAFAIALAIVLAMLMVGLRLSGFMGAGQSRELVLHDVDVLSESERGRLYELLGEDDARTLPRFPLITDIPPIDVRRPRRENEETSSESDR